MLRRRNNSANAPLTSDPLSVTILAIAPCRQYICSQKNIINEIESFLTKALHSVALDKSSLAHTMYLCLWFDSVISMTSTYTLVNIVAGVDTVMGIFILIVLRIWHWWQDRTWWWTSCRRWGQKYLSLIISNTACSPL